MTAEAIDPTYLPFSADDLRPHFLADADANVAYFVQSAAKYAAYARAMASGDVPPLAAKHACQIEKDERFWTASALKHLAASRAGICGLLVQAFGERPPFDSHASWEHFVGQGMRLILEAAIPSPKAYTDWLRENAARRHLVPYVRAAALRSSRALEGPTHVDGVFLNEVEGTAVMIEAKVLSDVSSAVSFDTFRNQLVRNLDVLLDRSSSNATLARRDPKKTVFLLLTPRVFKEQSHTRLYGWLYHNYRQDPRALARDLPHRTDLDTTDLACRLGWITFEDINSAIPGACRWLDACERPSG